MLPVNPSYTAYSRRLLRIQCDCQGRSGPGAVCYYSHYRLSCAVV